MLGRATSVGLAQRGPPLRKARTDVSVRDLDPALRLRFGFGLAVPPRMLPAQVLAAVQLDRSPDVVAPQLLLQYRHFLDVSFPGFVGGNVGIGWRLGAPPVVTRATWAGTAGLLWRSPHHQIGFEVIGGFDPAVRHTMGLNFVVAGAR